MATDALTQEYRSQLESERESLRVQLQELGFGADYDSNFADSSQVTAERGETEALVNALQEQLASVEHALAKFAAGKYGSCESCGQPIAEARLEASPSARLCITCASKR
jgi:RNA polymerase-binding transcription factor DksA